MVTRVEKIAFILLGVVVIALFVFWRTGWSMKSPQQNFIAEETKKGKKEKGKKSKDISEASAQSVQIIQKWELPAKLKEISGIAFTENKQLACIQDELGIIFIFDPKTGKVIREIEFGKPADYEGIAVVGSTAYVVVSNGKLFEVTQFESKNPKVSVYDTPLTAKQNVEGLCFDKQSNQLLLSIKGNEPDTKDYKGVYAFNIVTKKASSTPIYKIDLTHDIWKDGKGKNKMQPSDLEVNPATKEIYIIDGANPKLLVMDKKGEQKELYGMDSKVFEQPEGIAFSETGDLFISSEGVKGPGTIMRVAVGEKQ